MNKITHEMVIRLNDELKKKGCYFHYTLYTFIYPDGTNGLSIRRNINDHSEFFVDAVISCDKVFYEWLDKFFKDNYNIILDYSEDGNECWVHKET